MILSAFAGTFTIAGAAGASFEIWRDGAKVSEYTGTITAAIAAGSVVDGDTIKLTSDYESTGVEQSGMLINLTIDGQGHSMTNSGSGTRFFNLGDNSATAVDITVTFKNLTMTASNVSGFVQMNRPGEDVIFDNVNLKFNAPATSGTGAIIMIQPNQNVTIKNSSVTARTNFINIRNTNQVVNITDTKITVNAGSLAASHAFIRCETAAVGYELNLSGVSIDNTTGGNPITRMVASYAQDADVNVNDCTIFWRGTDSMFEMTGSGTSLTVDNSKLAYYANGDIVEVQAYTSGSTVGKGENVSVAISNSVLLQNGGNPAISVESGSNASVNVSNTIVKANSKSAIAAIADTTIVLNGVRAFSKGTSPVVATASKVTMSNTALSTDAAVPMLDDLAETADIAGANGYYATSDIVAPSASTADDFAAEVLLKPVRIADEATAYANGTFAGYYSSVTTAVAALNGATEVFVVGDYYTIGRETATGISTITGVAKADGSKPVVTTTQRFTGNVTTAMTYANFELVNTFDDCAVQINAGGVLTLNNMVVAADNANGCLVLQKGSSVIINDSTIDAMSSSGVRFNETADGQVPTAEINNSILKASEGGKAVYLLVDGIMNISEDSQVIVDDVDGFGIGSKTLTLNGKTITSNITAASMLPGASVRIARGNELAQSGIRFESTLSAEIIAEVSAMLEAGTLENATIGTVVFKKSDLGNKTVAELVEAANADANDALIVADIEAKNGIVENADGSATIRAAIINIKEKNYGVEFGAVAYIELTCENGATVRIYGDFDATNNVRSIKGVAELALADYEMEAGVVDGYNYYNEITVEIEGVETTVYSCYSDEQIAILNTYAGK